MSNDMNAFPFEVRGETGMTLRDYFAAHALTAIPPMQYNINTARKAYEIADAMLEARKK